MSSPHGIVKTYQRRGSMQQYRLDRPRTFHCFRCNVSKTSRLVTVYDGDWQRLLCNGCYGRLLSIYQIKAGSSPEGNRADELGLLLLSEADEDSALQVARRLAVSSAPETKLSPLSARFLGTAEIVADRVDGLTDLDWSVVVLGFCKALETEMALRVLKPLRTALSNENLDSDLSDKDLGRIARFCSSGFEKPPEMGSMAYFIRTAAFSRDRADSSPLLRAWYRLAAKQTDGAWLVAPSGLAKSLADVTSRFRNPAVHTAVLGRGDYEDCRNAIVGPDGALWALVVATDRT